MSAERIYQYSIFEESDGWLSLVTDNRRLSPFALDVVFVAKEKAERLGVDMPFIRIVPCESPESGSLAGEFYDAISAKEEQ